MNSYDQYVNNYPWLIILAIVVVFTTLTILFYYSRDKYEPEPISRIFLAFAYGVISVIPAFVVSVIVSGIIPNNTLLFTVIAAPIVEEFCKGYFVVVLSKDETFDGPLDGLVYGAMVGAGFAAVENMLYGFSAAITFSYSSGVELAFIRSLTLIIGHPFYTGLMGAGVGAYKVGINRSEYQKIWVSIVFHAVWNGVASISSPFGFFGGLIVIIVISIYKLRKELRKAILLDRTAFEQGYYTQKKEYYAYLEKMRQKTQWGYYHPSLDQQEREEFKFK